jgi:hypothetical protein
MCVAWVLFLVLVVASKVAHVGPFCLRKGRGVFLLMFLTQILRGGFTQPVLHRVLSRTETVGGLAIVLPG